MSFHPFKKQPDKILYPHINICILFVFVIILFIISMSILSLKIPLFALQGKHLSQLNHEWHMPCQPSVTQDIKHKLINNYKLESIGFRLQCLQDKQILVRAALCRRCLTAVGHYWSERSACAALGCWHKRRWPLFQVHFSTYLVVLLTTVIQNHRRGCRIVSNFCMWS